MDLHLRGKTALITGGSRGIGFAVSNEFVADFGAPGEPARIGGIGRDVDILVNNAGTITQGTMTEIDHAKWRAAWDLKIFGSVGVTRESYPAMCARQRGVIVTVDGGSGV